MRKTMLLLALAVIVLVTSAFGCEQPPLPAVGEVIFCPTCDRDLYQRVSGYSRTSFRRVEYTPLFYDTPLPEVGSEQYCPFCHGIIIDYENGVFIRSFYRERRGEQNYATEGSR